MSETIILASGSKTRAKLLQDAGVQIETIAPNIDEDSVKKAMLAEKALPDQIAGTLAEMKASKISNKNPNRLVLGSDQILVCEGKLFDKPKDIDDARDQLKILRGKSHQLITLVVAFEQTREVWRNMSRSNLVMRDFSDIFLDSYIDQQGQGLTDTAGAYKLETSGSQLFTRVDGDYFSILGLPLLEVLGFLRTRGIVQE